jgi:hypothetical protein
MNKDNTQRRGAETQRKAAEKDLFFSAFPLRLCASALGFKMQA